ncbi:MAG TPA: aminotransferase class V-fold PLP-dependent enzyme [Casimicrobiaceae bacterium]|nr:aminotransferase class V-fold PLP-dependent enzyme [Casimicrobiaceae bacterium]
MRSCAGPEAIESALAALGPGPLDEAGVAAQVAPLFSRALARRARWIDLANHSLGRPLDATAADVAEALSLWETQMGDAWDGWLAERDAYRARLARLCGAPRPDCIVPKTSAGQGLRAILNSYPRESLPRVIATRGEFDSVDVILRHYAHHGRIALALVEPRADGLFAAEDLLGAVRAGADLVVVSQVLFNTGQILPDLPAVVAAAHVRGARLLLDVYHSLGVFPVDLAALDVDFAIGGSYKYLRGGPGACYLYLHPRHLDGSLSTLDVGWFAKEEPFAYERPDPPRFAPGGDAFFESTPPILPLYQARAGQLFTLAIGVARLRAHSLAQQRRLVELLAERGVAATGGGEDRGAFAVVRLPGGEAERCSERLAERGVVTDARGPWLRLCPDVLTTDDELVRAAEQVARALRG